MRARFVSTKGPYLDALIDVGGRYMCVMDEFSVDERATPNPGQEIEFEFNSELEDGESWEEIFSGNPEKRIGLEQVKGWRYRAYGQIESICPVRVNCGLLHVEGVINTNDAKVVGEFVSFTISRLGGYAYAT